MKEFGVDAENAFNRFKNYIIRLANNIESGTVPQPKNPTVSDEVRKKIAKEAEEAAKRFFPSRDE